MSSASGTEGPWFKTWQRQKFIKLEWWNDSKYAPYSLYILMARDHGLFGIYILGLYILKVVLTIMINLPTYNCMLCYHHRLWFAFLLFKLYSFFIIFYKCLFLKGAPAPMNIIKNVSPKNLFIFGYYNVYFLYFLLRSCSNME